MDEQPEVQFPVHVLAGISVPVIVTLFVLIVGPTLRSEASPAPTPVPSNTPVHTLTFTPLPPASGTPTQTPLPTTTSTPSPTLTPSNTPLPTNTPSPTPYRDPLSVSPPLNLNEILPWDGSGPVTVLVMGVDRRPSQGGRSRTDTMLVMRLDPSTNAAGMVSIPRDLFVEIPGYGRRRINSAYVYGGGVLARRTAAEALGIQIDYYAVIDFVAFVTLVDEIDGIDVAVSNPISDQTYPDHNYGYDPLYIPEGMHHMDGTMALAYARSRHGNSDYDRASRQQEVLMALRNKAIDFDMLPHLLVRAPGLWSILANSVDTNLPFDQIVSLAVAAGEIPGDHIDTAVIDGSYVFPITLDDGAQVLWPNEARIHTLVADTLP